jgi:hypothetical protein
MFSGSNSYLGGQSGRPGGQQQYNQFQPPQQAQQPQQSFLNPNPTGYGQPPVQPNFTGYPLQGQPTGYNPQQMQQQQTGFPGQQNPSAFGNVQAPVQKPQPTGFAAMADSFKTTPSAAPARGRRSSKAKAGTRIPNIRLSFITAQDQAKFETLFKSAVGDGQTLSGDKSRDLLMRSKLDGNSLSQIW